MPREALDRIAADAAKHRGQSDVLILGRYRHSRPGNVAGLARQYPGLRFSCMTVHRAKGLEADHIVVFGQVRASRGNRRRSAARSGAGGARRLSARQARRCSPPPDDAPSQGDA